MRIRQLKQSKKKWIRGGEDGDDNKDEDADYDAEAESYA
jgi:hypothetical protein